MKKIDLAVSAAVRNLRNFHRDNTRVVISPMLADPNGRAVEVYLHGHNIFSALWKPDSGYIWWARHCGWQTPTTKARLNTCLAAVNAPVFICIRNWEFVALRCSDNKPADRQFDETGVLA